MCFPRALGSLLLVFLASLVSVDAKDPVHILYLTDCTKYSDWQAVGMDFSFRNSGQKGHMTRVMCCTDEEKAAYNHDMLDLMPSHVAPSFAYNEKTKDHYAAFNKPGAVLDFMTKGQPMADYMLVIDSDMQLRHPFRPDIYNMTRGKAISADYTYMIGCTNDLATRHIPEIELRHDTLAGPMDRHCDMVGGYTFMHRDDLSKVAPLWLSVTVDVREDPESWRLSGDQYVEKGGKPWISEMYGYSFACAKSDVWHQWDTHVMHYPTYEPTGVPKLMHYGLFFEVDGYKFDKHWHYNLDMSKCPPWDLSTTKDIKAGLFAHPPAPSTLKSKDGPVRRYYRDLMSIETVATLNAGFCDYHLKHCPPTQQLFDECKKALDIYTEVKAEVVRVELEFDCQDVNIKCEIWKSEGQCESNKDYMLESCKKTCGACGAPTSGGAPQPLATQGAAAAELAQNLLELKIKLRHEVSPPIIPQNVAVPEGAQDKKVTGEAPADDVAKVNADEANGAGKQSMAEADDKAAEEKLKAEADTKAAEEKTMAEAAAKAAEEKTTAEAAALAAEILRVKAEADAQQKKVMLLKAEADFKAAKLQEGAEQVVQAERIRIEGVKLQSPTPDAAAAQAAAQTSRRLKTRCQRLAISLPEVKLCLADAKNGIEYQHVKEEPPAEVRKLAEEVVTLEAGNIQPDAATDGEGAKASKVISAPASTRMPLWQVLGLWLVVIGIFLTVLPSLFRKRARSGKRTE